MNVNMSNASATTKTSGSDTVAKTVSEPTEKKGFFETLAGVFSGSQETEKVRAHSKPSSQRPESVKSVKGDETLHAVDEPSAEKSITSEDSDELVAGKNTNVALSQDEFAATDLEGSDTELLPSSLSSAKSVMGEGKQLLGQLQQASQTLQNNKPVMNGGKALPLDQDMPVMDGEANLDTLKKEELDDDGLAEHLSIDDYVTQSPLPIDWHSPFAANKTSELAVDELSEGHASKSEQGNVGKALSLPSATTLKMLETIDAKLGQGQPLSDQEQAVLESINKGELSIDVSEQNLSQLSVLPNETKLALNDGLTRHASSVAVSGSSSNITGNNEWQTSANQTAPVATVQTQADKSAMMPLPDSVSFPANAQSLEGLKLSTDIMSKKLTADGLTASGLQSLSEAAEKPDSQSNLAGQIQSLVNQQTGLTSPAVKIDAAGQVQSPLLMTKEMAEDQVSEKIQMMMSKNLKNLDIRLDPPELGRMQIRMAMNNDLANVHFTVSNPQARELIEQTLPRLREMFAQQGMQLADSSVEQQSSGQQQNGYTQADPQQAGAQERRFSGQTDENFEAEVNLDLNVPSNHDGISFYA
ncbi:flagellar hook-length control protein FliK [Vibrio sagamiensis]|uniref:Flagellar hook-length control protein FliK n=1 Tax=Vibrio sagamiensis NBRC 104589 TaxID=1219064 RepID=A0A511QAR7_9VIBR|nr:flagellar hook-length control protein FliK [Vibrio sagamiensis]PNQ71460.1 flagellar hook-length control protein FliK [Vibrio agarivorans]GEM74336.1 flagellar hook-length control protein FliK [Vibrio sagamiensis NBRC 104589]